MKEEWRCEGNVRAVNGWKDGGREGKGRRKEGLMRERNQL